MSCSGRVHFLVHSWSNNCYLGFQSACHGRGREFESRRPRHLFQKSCSDFSETIEGAKGCNSAPYLHPFALIRAALREWLFAISPRRPECGGIRFRSEDQRKHGCLRGVLCWRNRLRVDIQRGSQRRMPQQLLHDFEFCSDASQQRRECVPERVPSESLLNPEPLCDGANELAQDCLTPNWLSTPVASARENPVIGVRISGAFPPFRESIQNDWLNRHGFL